LLTCSVIAIVVLMVFFIAYVALQLNDFVRFLSILLSLSDL